MSVKISKFQSIIKKLGIDETFTKLQKRQKKFNKIINNIPLREDYNFMADLLMMPTTSKGFKYLLTMVDLATGELEMEPMKTKDSKTTLKAMKNIFKRKILKLPYASIRTDNGGEFKSEFNKYLLKNGVLHKFALPYRHKQMSVIENVNSQLSRLLLGYTNAMTMKKQKYYDDWTDIIAEVRTELNKYRKRDLSKIKQPTFSFAKAGLSKYNVGDLVHYKLDVPLDALNNKVADKGRFRNGDVRYSPEVYKIEKVLMMNDYPYYRYLLTDIPNVSYSDHELIASKNKEETRLVKSIFDKMKKGNKTYYKVWFKKELKRNSVWLPKKQLIEDGFKQLIDDLELKLKNKKKK